MPSLAEFVPVSDPDALTRAKALSAMLIDPPSHFRAEWLLEHRWAAVPVESAKHFEEIDAKRISNASQRLGVKECLAIATEPLENHPTCYRVSASIPGLLQFSRECGLFAYVLVPESCAWSVLCDFTLYYLVAGPRQFVEDAIGCSIHDGRSQFREFADAFVSTGIDPHVAEHGRALHEELLGVATRYEGCDGE